MLSLALAWMVFGAQVPTAGVSNWTKVEGLVRLIGKGADAIHGTLGDPVEIKQGRLGEGPDAVEVASFYYVYDTKTTNDERLDAAIVIRKSDRKAIGVEGKVRPAVLARDVKNWDACKGTLLGPLPWRPLRAYVKPLRTDGFTTQCAGTFVVYGTRSDGLEVAMRTFNAQAAITQTLTYDAKALDFDRTWVWGPSFSPSESEVSAFAIGVPLETPPGADPPETGTLVTYAAG